jgi:hypothetical protein
VGDGVKLVKKHRVGRGSPTAISHGEIALVVRLIREGKHGHFTESTTA